MADRAPRTVLDEEQAEKFLIKYIADRAWTPKQANKAVRHCAAARWAALARGAAKAATVRAPAKAPKKAKPAAKKAA